VTLFHFLFSVYLLVRLVGPLWVSDLCKKIVLLLEDKVLHIVHQILPGIIQERVYSPEYQRDTRTGCLCSCQYPQIAVNKVTQTSIHVHLDDTMVNGGLDFLLGRARATVENKIAECDRSLPHPSEKKTCHPQWFLNLAASLLFSIRLVLGKKLGVQSDISGFVNSVHVTESSRYAKVGTDFRQRIVYIVDVLRLGVQAAVVDTGIVDTIFLTARDTDFHFKPETYRRHAFEILDARRDVLFLRLLGEIKHVRGEQGFLVLLVVLLVCCEHAIEPRKELFGTVIGVQDYGTDMAEPRVRGVKTQMHSTIATYTPYTFDTVRMWCAAAIAPVMDACCLSLANPFPAKYALPPCET
jgi:hypothetical protein